jgi:hypothetical protein
MAIGIFGLSSPIAVGFDRLRIKTEVGEVIVVEVVNESAELGFGGFEKLDLKRVLNRVVSDF